jgi:hypothetical protein
MNDPLGAVIGQQKAAIEPSQPVLAKTQSRRVISGSSLPNQYFRPASRSAAKRMSVPPDASPFSSSPSRWGRRNPMRPSLVSTKWPFTSIQMNSSSRGAGRLMPGQSVASTWRPMTDRISPSIIFNCAVPKLCVLGETLEV